MKRRNLTLIVMLAFGNLALCQNADYAFKVLANKGISEYKSGDAWQQLRTGAALKADDEIKVADNSYVGLVHATGKPLELKQAGSYKVADLASKIKSGSSVLNKYTDFILSSNSPEAKKNRLNATGAVHRGDPDAKPIQLYLPDNQHGGLLNNSALISWEGSAVKGPFLVVFKDMFDEEIFRMETPEHSFKLDMTTPKFAKLSALNIEVKSLAGTNDASKQYMIKRVTGAEAEAVKKQMEEMGTDINEPSALNKWILGEFYERNKLYIDALTALEEAHKMAPDVPEITAAYEDFLVRNGFKK